MSRGCIYSRLGHSKSIEVSLLNSVGIIREVRHGMASVQAFYTYHFDHHHMLVLQLLSSYLPLPVEAQKSFQLPKHLAPKKLAERVLLEKLQSSSHRY